MKAGKKTGLCLIKEWQGYVPHASRLNRDGAGINCRKNPSRPTGNPQVDKKKVERALKLYESKEYSVAEITELTGVSKATLYRRLKSIDA
jgi:DNA invertase Pin-like site-specific DNA recombinase